MPNEFRRKETAWTRNLFGDCGGTVNGVVREGCELYKVKFAGNWRARQKVHRTSGNYRALLTEMTTPDPLPCFKFYHFVYENLHEFFFEKNPQGQVVLVQGWIGHYSAWEWFFPETFETAVEAFGLTRGRQRQGTKIYADQANTTAQRTAMLQKKALYGEGQDLTVDARHDNDKLTPLLTALGEMLDYPTYHDIPMRVWQKLPFPPRVAKAVSEGTFLMVDTLVDHEGRGEHVKSYLPVKLEVAPFPVDDTSLDTMRRRFHELEEVGMKPRFLSDVILFDAFMSCAFTNL